jgi:hypothetical protein
MVKKIVALVEQWKVKASGTRLYSCGILGEITSGNMRNEIQVTENSVFEFKIVKFCVFKAQM